MVKIHSRAILNLVCTAKRIQHVKMKSLSYLNQRVKWFNVAHTKIFSVPPLTVIDQ